MKKLTSILLIVLPALSFAQYNEFMPEFFFVRQPGARSEAMGKTSVAVDGDMTSSCFNPAGAATIQGFDINASTSSPMGLAKKGRYSFLSVGCKLGKKFALGVSRNHFSFGKLGFSDENGDFLGYYKPYDSNYGLRWQVNLLKTGMQALMQMPYLFDLKQKFIPHFIQTWELLKK